MIIKGHSKVKFTTKAETLHQLKEYDLSCELPDIDYFDLEEWRNSSLDILERIECKYNADRVAVRSSAKCEDGSNQSNAGAFESVLNVDPRLQDVLKQAIEYVFSSFPEDNGNDQVLIQRMVKNVAVSGVILTRYVDDGSPYYILNYDDETGRSDSITGGTGEHKTVMVYRNYKPEYCDSERVRKMLSLAREIETICGEIPLDIEFAIDQEGFVYLLQVRRISTVGGWHPDTEHRVSRVMPHLETFVEQQSARRTGLFGDFTILGNMPDWNPAELIGAVPFPLAASLFRKLITSRAWSEARAQMGYRRLPQTELMVLVGIKPFIDVRASFNSFLPEGVSDNVGDKLINAWLERLADNPSLHDKVEFEVAQTVLDFDFERKYNERYSEVLNPVEKLTFKEKLTELTNRVLDITDYGNLPQAIAKINQLATKQEERKLGEEINSPISLAAYIAALLEECIHEGTVPFSAIARHGFVAESLLRSAVQREAISQERIDEFKASFGTIMGELSADTRAVCEGSLSEEEFHKRYGHLRPGTFDIMSPCYRNRPDLFENCSMKETVCHDQPFVLQDEEVRSINDLLEESGLNTVDAQSLLEYAQKAIQGREYAKFVFTRNLSKALECIVQWGEYFNLGREDLSYLKIEDILDTCFSSTRDEVTSVLMQKVDKARLDYSFAKLIKLSYLIRGVKDIHIVPIYRSEPNFITQKFVEKQCIFLDPATLDHGFLNDCIVCIDNADPGFDWIFTKGIAGLITKYGGANSHMAIRCAELQLPAAIGCGEELFERLRGYRKISLDCSSKVIRPL